MNDYQPTGSEETNPARRASSEASGPRVAGSSAGTAAAPLSQPPALPDSPASATNPKQARRPRARRMLSNRNTRWIVPAVLIGAVVAGCASASATSPSASATSPSASATSPSATTGHPGQGGGAAGGGSNARSGPAAGGSSGTVDSVSTSGFTLSTPAGQKVTVDETSSTTYQNGTSSTSASAITKGEGVLVLGTASGTTITATQVTVQPNGGGSAASTSTAAGVVPFKQGAPTTSKQVGQIPANYKEGSGTIVSGTTANKATVAALAAYPGGVVDRVVQLGNGEYEVHYIGVNWPHHIFVNQDFAVVGAD
jgi:hypothetical protein